MTTLAATPSQEAQPSTADPNAPWNVCHRLCARKAEEMTLFAAMTGLHLMDEKEKAGHGHWIPWIAANCEYGRRTASSYLATAEKALVALGIAHLPLPDAIAHLGSIANHDGAMKALIAALNPPKPETAPTATPKPVKPRKPRPAGPRPLFASPKALPKAVERWKATPETARHQFLDSIRDEAEAHYQATKAT